MTIRSVCALACLCVLLGGCGGAREQPPLPEPKRYSAEEFEDKTPPPPTLAATDTGPSRVTVDAMVGQINGRPVYASEIFEQIGTDSLNRLGAARPRTDFRRESYALLQEHLMARVQSELILAEAESDLTPEQQVGLLGILKMEREKILAQFFGSEAETQRGLQQQRGMSLEEYLEAKRQQVLVEKYLQEKLYPKINVTRRDVERYYTTHAAEFNPDPTVALRLMTVETAEKADEVDKALATGKSFEEVAREYSTRLAARGGLLPPFKTTVADFRGLKWQALNEKIRALQPGQRTDRTSLGTEGFGWVELVSVTGGETQSLTEVYPAIENRLRVQQMDQLSRQYNLDLLKKGNFTPLDEMLAGLLDVAMARYARPE